MRGAIPLLPPYIFMAWCLVKHRDKALLWNIKAVGSIPDKSDNLLIAEQNE
jgi:hypothetical protein